MRDVRGNDISMIFQEPMTSLNPVMTIGKQIAETLRLHQDLSRQAAFDKAIDMLRLVKIPEPAQRAKEYPHQLSGGMRQRAMIAMALSCNPKVLIADEPTTALDVTIQAQILDLILDLQKTLGTAVILITHDLAVVAETAQRVIVMYAGKKVEEAEVESLFSEPLAPLHAWPLSLDPAFGGDRRRTAGGERTAQGNSGHGAGAHQSAARLCLCPALRLCRRPLPLRRARLRAEAAGSLGGVLALGAALWLVRRLSRTATTPCRSAMRTCSTSLTLKKHFPVKKGLLRRTVGQVYAVDGVSFSIGEGETLGLVGESGCGKSTVARTVLRLIEPTAGSIMLEGKDVTRLGKAAMRPYRRQMQMIFQDPFSSLNPRMSVADIVGEPLEVHDLAHGKDKQALVAGLFDQVGLRRSQMKSFPHEFSGGQRQRISIARALALNPRLIIADEPVSALDVSIQAQVINLMMDLQREKRLSYLFIAHDLAVVEHISHRIAVMYLGKIVEYADKKTLFTNPLHPYTQALLSAVPVPNPKLRREKRLLQGDVPSPINPPPGCTFHTRCPYAQERCRQEVPVLKEIAPGHGVSCHLVN